MMMNKKSSIFWNIDSTTATKRSTRNQLNKKVYCRIFLSRTPKNPNVILAKETTAQEKNLVWYQQHSISVSLSNRLV